ncbi:DUF2062 domain-containing protein [Thiorhodococcus minor]|uniref:DUF2062 domain-containing protein n=1 Tax=Thiorhodococcus minor TaxID=57489 RepID=A0A6M0K1B6_9GAMM|nr:DUF2062 domain-containing protein [Thiorhodococcus minor]
MKKWLRRVMPPPKAIHGNRCLGVFGKLLQDPNLWHLNRHSVAGAFAVGLFVMYLPPVGHVLIAGGLAIYLRVNLPIAITLVWISNPVTIPPMFYFAYVVGCWVLGIPPVGFKVQFWLDWHNWLAVLGPLLLGCLICGAVCSVLGYATIQILWRWKLMRQIRKRKERYRELSESRLRTPSSNRQT